MSYYETFKPGPDTAIGKLDERVKSLGADIRQITKNLADEKNTSKSLKRRIQEQKLLASEALMGSKNAYEKYRTTLTKLSGKLETSESMINSLSDSLSNKQVELSGLKGDLKILLDAHLLRSRPVADERIKELLRECIFVRQDFIDSFKKVYAEYGIDFFFLDSSYCPGPWVEREVRDMCQSLGLVYDKGTISAPTKPPEPVQTPPAEAPADDSQDVEPEAANPEASGTKSGITLLT